MSYLHPDDADAHTPLLRDASTSTGYDATLNEVDHDCAVCGCCNDGEGTLHTHALPPAANIPTLPKAPQVPQDKKWIPNPEAEWNDPKHPEHKARPRTLILCFDGTGDQFDDDNSNVVQFLAALKKDDQRFQLVYYQAGIGTYTNSSIVTPVMSQVSKTLDEMFAWNLGTHVMEGYQFLMQNYTAGDKICIFGFSRGAYTARSLAGMIQKVGLLPAYNTQQVPFAWAMYNREDEDGWRNSQGFKETFSIDVQIEFVGVWDTVASVGLVPRELPFVANNSAITYFRHALALDEHRAKFIPNFYHSSKEEQEKLAAEQQAAANRPSAVPLAGSESANGKGSGKGKSWKRKNMSDSEIHQAAYNAAEAAKSGIITDSKEVWFSGCHCDIGGGSVPNHTRHSLARIPLRWMIRETFACNTGIIFDANILRDDIGLDPENLYPVYKPRDPSLRIKPNSSHSIAPRASQGFWLWGALKTIGSLLAIPFQFIFKIIWFPVEHTWLLLKYSLGRKIRHWTGWGKKGKRTASKVPQPSMLDEQGHESLGVNRTPFVSEELEDLNDILSPEYDQLQIRWFWWIIELLPLRFRDQKGSRDDFFVRANLGQGRRIYGDARLKGIKVHHTVKTRLEVGNYKPRAYFNVGTKGNRKPVTEWNVENPDPKSQWQWVY